MVRALGGAGAAAAVRFWQGVHLWEVQAFLG